MLEEETETDLIEGEGEGREGVVEYMAEAGVAMLCVSGSEGASMVARTNSPSNVPGMPTAKQIGCPSSLRKQLTG